MFTIHSYNHDGYEKEYESDNFADAFFEAMNRAEKSEGYRYGAHYTLFMSDGCAKTKLVTIHSEGAKAYRKLNPVSS